MKQRKPNTTTSLLALVIAFSAVISVPMAHAANAFTIMQIQGTGSRSPITGQTVTTTGVVFDIVNNGFWMQDPNGDGDPATSDGIFVQTGSTPTVHKGDGVSVTGVVAEVATANDPSAAPETQLANPTIATLSTGNALPLPVTITAKDVDPNGSIGQLERFEGMRVHVDTLNVVAPTGGVLNEPNATSTTDGVFYGVIPGLPRAFRGAGIELPAAAPSGSPCCIPFWNGAPQRLRVDTKTLSSALDLSTGAVISGLTGPLTFAQHTYTIVTETTPVIVTGNGVAVSAPVPDASEFTVATLLLQHFYNAADDPSFNDVVLTTTAYNNRLKKASLAIRNVMMTPDIVGVQEVEDLPTLQALANKVNSDAVAAGGPNPGYTGYVIPGNDAIGINSGFLVKPRITVNSVNQYGKNDIYYLPGGGVGLLYDRPLLVLDATVTNDHESTRFLVINVHNVSTTNIDNPSDGARARERRRAQAEYAANLMQSFQAADSQAKIVTLGDINAFAVNDGYVDGLGTFLGSPTPATQVVLSSSDLVDPNFTNLETTLAPEQRYDFLNFGTAETLDYILASQGMMSIFSRFAYARGNVDFPEVYRNDPNRPERLSNHDAPVAYFKMPADHTPPVLTLPADFSVEANATAGAQVTYTATANDSNDGVVSVTCTPASGTNFPVATTTVSCSAQDAHQNTATGTFHVSVTDTTAPVLTLPSDLAVNATSAAGAIVTYSAIANDIVDGSVSVSCNPASGSTFALGTTLVSCTTHDAHNNVASGEFHVSVADNSAPVLTLPADISVEAISATGAVVAFNATALDGVDGSVAVTCVPASGSTFPLGSNVVSCTTEDAHHNVATGEFHVNVVDTKAPVLTLPADISMEATGATGALVTYIATALDAVDGSVTVTCNPASGSTFPVGSNVVSCTTEDAHHNSVSGQFHVNVGDTKPPVLTLPADISLEAANATGAVATFSATAVDDVDGAVPVTCNPASGSTFPVGSNVVSCTSQDAHHNSVNGQFHVNVGDTKAPVLTLPADISLEAANATGAVATFSATAIDAVDGAVPVTCNPASGSTFPVGSNVVSCTSQDAHHNSVNGQFHVNVTDTRAPVLTLPADMTVTASSSQGVAVTYLASAFDLVDGATPVVCSPASGSIFAVGTTTVSCTTQDSHHNLSSGQFHVSVRQNGTPPVVKVTGVVNGAEYTLGSVPAAHCSTTPGSSPIAVNASLSLTGGTANGVGSFTATCSGAKDVAGNVAPAVSATYTVRYVWSGFLGLDSREWRGNVPLTWILTTTQWKIAGSMSSFVSMNVAANPNCAGAPEGNAFPAAPGSTISFTNGLFQFNWKTTGVPNGCYTVMLGLDDGSTRTAIVHLKSDNDDFNWWGCPWKGSWYSDRKTNEHEYSNQKPLDVKPNFNGLSFVQIGKDHK